MRPPTPGTLELNRRVAREEKPLLNLRVLILKAERTRMLHRDALWTHLDLKGR